MNLSDCIFFLLCHNHRLQESWKKLAISFSMGELEQGTPIFWASVPLSEDRQGNGTNPLELQGVIETMYLMFLAHGEDLVSVWCYNWCL